MSKQRLIDANALKAKAFGKRGGLIHTADIDAMPTIEERKTGKWERHYSRPNVYADLCWHCSNCGYSTPDNWANKWQYAMIEHYEHKMPKIIIEPIEELKIIAWAPLPEGYQGGRIA